MRQVLIALILSRAFLGCQTVHTVERDYPLDWRVSWSVRNDNGVLYSIQGLAYHFKESDLHFHRDSIHATPQDGGEAWSLPVSDVAEFHFERRRRGLGALLGAFLGFAGGYVMGDAIYGDCSSLCIGEALAAVGVFLGGGAFGTISGAIIVTSHTTVYRFRPDTPQQMSVVIRVGPSMSSHEQNVDGYGEGSNR